MTAASLGLAHWGHRAHQHPLGRSRCPGARRSSAARSLEAKAGDPPQPHHSHGGEAVPEGGPRPHLLLSKESRAPQCTVRLSTILLTLSRSHPDHPRLICPRAMPFLGRSGVGAHQDQGRRASGPRPPAHRGSAPHCPLRRAGCPLEEAKIISPTSSLWSPWLSVGPDPRLMRATGRSPRGRVRPSQSEPPEDQRPLCIPRELSHHRSCGRTFSLGSSSPLGRLRQRLPRSGLQQGRGSPYWGHWGAAKHQSTPPWGELQTNVRLQDGPGLGAGGGSHRGRRRPQLGGGRDSMAKVPWQEGGCERTHGHPGNLPDPQPPPRGLYPCAKRAS